VNWLARRGRIEQGSELFGKAFESWVFHELNCYNASSGTLAEFSYWRLSTGVEVDFIVNDMACAIEVKPSSRITDSHLKGLRELAKDHPDVKARYVVSNESHDRKTSDGIHILGVSSFLESLWSGRMF
jgi:predicted AAA+ superfamily ATPase